MPERDEGFDTDFRTTSRNRARRLAYNSDEFQSKFLQSIEYAAERDLPPDWYEFRAFGGTVLPEALTLHAGQSAFARENLPESSRRNRLQKAIAPNVSIVPMVICKSQVRNGFRAWFQRTMRLTKR